MSAINPTPDFAGFDASQRLLIDLFGRDVRFYGPADVIYDPSLPTSEFDDEGIPLDPLSVASGSNEDTTVPVPGLTPTASAHCNVVFAPLQTSLQRKDQSTSDALGVRPGLNRDLILNFEDKDVVDGATHFMVGTNTAGTWNFDDLTMYEISQTTPDNFGPIPRYIVYGQRA
jgi:hypothetical protein